MTPEEINLILRHLRDQGYPAVILDWEEGVSVTIGITLTDEGTPGESFRPSK